MLPEVGEPFLPALAQPVVECRLGIELGQDVDRLHREGVPGVDAQGRRAGRVQAGPDQDPLQAEAAGPLLEQRLDRPDQLRVDRRCAGVAGMPRG